MSVTIKDIANQTGLSWPTVSRILNGKGHLFKPDTRDRVIAKAKELGYVPNAAARGIRTNRTYHIGVLLLNDPAHPLHYPASLEILQGINHALEPAGYVLSMIRIMDVQDDRRAQSRVFREKMLDGMICLDALPQHLVDVVRKLITKCVWVDSNNHKEQFCVYREEQTVGQIAAQHMIDLGYRHIKFLISGNDLDTRALHFSTKARWHGIEKTCKKASVKVSQTQIPHWKTALPAAEVIELWQDSAGLIANGPHDAIRLMNNAHQLNLPVGRHIGVATCDMTEELKLTRPALAHVTNDRYELGRKAGEMMLNMLENPDSQCPSQTMTGLWQAGASAQGPQSES